MWEQKDFLTLEEAEVYGAGENMRSLGFCPIIKSACNPQCICFQKTKPVTKYGVGTTSYTVVSPGCDNPMVTGFYNMENG
jgi:hypothetical protein